MKLFEYIDRLNLLHKLIKERRTGCPEMFAKRLGISTIRLYQTIEELKLMQIPINYSKRDKTYFYEIDYELTAQVVFRPLSNKELEVINAGCFLQVHNFNSFLKL